MNLVAMLVLTAAPSTVPADQVIKESKVVLESKPPLLAIERNIVKHTNTERARHGLPPLQVDSQLMQQTRQHAMWMATRRVMQHTSAAVAENIAAGQRSPDEVVRDWMNSPGHRSNILGSQYKRIGVAAYRGADGQVYWCQQFLW